MIREKILHSSEPVFLIDGSSFLYRAFYAFPDLKRSDGFPTNAIFIVIRMLLKIIREENPKYIGFFMDGKGPTFRHKLYKPYKAKRMKMPEGLNVQIDPLMEGVRLLGVPEFKSEGVEADDLIAGYAGCYKKDHPVIIVASDKDLKQLLDEHVYIWDPGSKNSEPVNAEGFRRETGIDPSQWPDYQALVGDTSDNIPGVPGVGPKTALTWLKRFPTLEDLKECMEELKPKEQDKLRAHLEDIFLYRRLTRLKHDCLRQASLEDLKSKEPDVFEFTGFLRRYEFRSLLEEFSSDPGISAKDKVFKDEKKIVALDKEELPDGLGEEAGVFPVESGFLVALKDSEWLVDQGQEVREKLKECKKFVFYLKNLYQADPLWMDEPVSEFLDITLGAYLLNPEERDYSYDRIFKTYASEAGVHRNNKALAALKIGRLVENKLSAAGLKSLMNELEMPLVPVLCRMEKIGVNIDLDAFRDFLDQVERWLKDLTREIYALAGREFNVRSTQQTAQVLFQDLGLRSRRKTPTGAFSTSNAVLESMRSDHPIIGLILEYRTLEKLRSTYLDPLPKKVCSSGRLHTSFNQLATATGRLSSSKPNLQNIPIRGSFGIRMRACFTAAEGKLLVGADYSQIELRILAHMSRDPSLLQAFAANEDIHLRTAGLLFDKDIGQVSQEERRKAKTINFGLLYGMGPQKMSRELAMSIEEAKKFIKVYFSKLEKVRKLYQSIEEQAQQYGYVTTITGRRRLLPDINSRNEHLAQQARRAAVNTVIQGSAADVIKKAMLAVDSDERLKSMEANLVLQVHDELLLEVEDSSAHAAGERLAEIMTRVEKFEVPLLVQWGVGKNWAQAHG